MLSAGDNMSTSYWLDQSNVEITPQPKNTKHDFIIIGAGIAGLSTAYWLEKKHPKAKIKIMDKATMGFGASGRNAGFVTCGSALHFKRLEHKFGLEQAAKIWKFSEANHQLLLQEIIQDDFSTVEYKKTGACTVIPTGSDPVKFKNILSTMKSVEIDVEMLTQAQLKQDYAVKSSEGGIEYRHDGVIHPVKLLQKIKSQLKNTDFSFHQNIAQLPQAEKIFVCTNGYTAELFPEFKALVLPQRGQIMVTAPVAPLIKGPCYLTEHLCYFRQLTSGEILVGGFRNRDAQNENTSTDEITPKIQSALEDFVRNYFSGTQNIEINYRWSGIMGFTPDEQMMVGEHPRQRNVHIMAGCSGHGMGLSFHAAKVMVEDAVPAFFDINRFKI